MSDVRNCPWCDTLYNEGQLDCRRCGGPLPAPIGSDPGPNPPHPPRELPSGYKRKMLLTNSPMALVGGIFALVGAPFMCVFPGISFTTGDWLFLIIGGGLGGIFTVLGGIILYFGIQSGLAKIRPFQFGLATRGEVVEIYQDRSIQVNGRSPWVVLYQFQVMGQAYEGRVLSWKYAPQQQAPGNAVHVLYMPNNPDENTIYPPVS